ncbi:hypothetical protein BUALT_Bualt06G0071700 [Buddleja alternifolia]|uniref:Uncharacterized protein n=1 Tax=Buddleja alternifolia TaxID=168488 RepID=A0AAV6XDE2_9LAMI|nr:hypothetical protein BUALT_Bualt06G0071700 [Buddleja alternifolia]
MAYVQYIGGDVYAIKVDEDMTFDASKLKWFSVPGSQSENDLEPKMLSLWRDTITGVGQMTSSEDASSKLIASIVEDKLKDTPQYRAREIINEIEEFDKKMNKIKKISLDAFVWLKNSEPYRSEKIYAQGCRFDYLTTNVAESFNGWILQARGFPLWRLAYAKVINPKPNDDMPVRVSIDNSNDCGEENWYFDYENVRGSSQLIQILPPNVRRHSGCPKRKRIESQPVVKRSLCCSRCHEQVAISKAMREHLDSQNKENEEVMSQKTALRETLMEPIRKKHGLIDEFVNYDESDDEIFLEERERINISMQRSIEDVHEKELGLVRNDFRGSYCGATSRDPSGKRIQDTVLKSSFWGSMELVCNLHAPVFKSPAEYGWQDTSYNGLRFLKECAQQVAIEAALPRSYKKYCDIIDKRLKGQMIRDIHLAAYYLNPAYHYELELSHKQELLQALKKVLQKIELDENIAALALSEAYLAHFICRHHMLYFDFDIGGYDKRKVDLEFQSIDLSHIFDDDDDDILSEWLDDPGDALFDKYDDDGQPVRPNIFLATRAERLSGPSKNGDGSNKGVTKLSNVANVIDEEMQYCGKEMKGSGISRLKQHIAGGFPNVEKCLQCPVAISRAMREHMDSQKKDNEEVMTQKAALRDTLMEPMRKKHGNVNNFVNDDEPDDEIFPEERERLNIAMQRSIEDVHENELGRVRDDSRGSYHGASSSRHVQQRNQYFGGKDDTTFKTKTKSFGKMTKVLRIEEMDPLLYRNRACTQQKISNILKENATFKTAKHAIGKRFIFSNIPPNAASNIYYQAAIDEIARAGAGVIGMQCSKLPIEVALPRSYKKYCDIIDRRLQEQMIRDIHLAGYYLNSAYHYELELSHKQELLDALKKVVQKIESDENIVALTLFEGKYSRDAMYGFADSAAIR